MFEPAVTRIVAEVTTKRWLPSYVSPTCKGCQHILFRKKKIFTTKFRPLFEQTRQCHGLGKREHISKICLLCILLLIEDLWCCGYLASAKPSVWTLHLPYSMACRIFQVLLVFCIMCNSQLTSPAEQMWTSLPSLWAASPLTHAVAATLQPP